MEVFAIRAHSRTAPWSTGFQPTHRRPNHGAANVSAQRGAAAAESSGSPGLAVAMQKDRRRPGGSHRPNGGGRAHFPQRRMSTEPELRSRECAPRSGAGSARRWRAVFGGSPKASCHSLFCAEKKVRTGTRWFGRAAQTSTRAACAPHSHFGIRVQWPTTGAPISNSA